MSDTLTREQAVTFLSRAERFGIHPSLDTIRALAAALERPQDDFRVVQVAGTNGKTSVARMTAALLEAEGLSTGLYLSPMLAERTDQFEIGGSAIGPDEFAAAVSAVARAAEGLSEPPTEFELTTATALVGFRDAGVDWAVLEVGMGGRWDATSVATADVAVVTGVDLDHVEHLGETRERIAAEKAEIMRQGGKAVLGPGVAGVLEVFLRRAEDQGVPVVEVTEAPVRGGAVFEVSSRLSGPGGTTGFTVSTSHYLYERMSLCAPSYQVKNAAVAIAATEEALGRKLDAMAAREALAGMRFPGRFEVVAQDPTVVVDGAHNPAAAAMLAGAVEEAFGEDRPVVVLGVLRDKDAAGIAEALAGVAGGWVVAESGSDRAMPVDDLASLVEKVTGAPPRASGSLSDALAFARDLGGPVLVTGSLTTAAEARALARG